MHLPGNMMEKDSAAAAHTMMMPDTSSSSSSSSDSPDSSGVRDLLAMARRLILDGNPSQALQAVLMAMKIKGGDQAMLQSLHRARELYRQRLHETTEMDRLASLFAECAISEADPEPAPTFHNAVYPLNNNGTAILAETGRDQIVLDAFADGSSFICLQCGGLVSVNRKDEHYTYWCG
uniref:C2HC zinc finger plants domain-containing protein n=1 Tax=Kalanchoe fedtschenkoi TaxID=63787 RepID=A0A7N0UNQ0_KALFE